MIEGYDLQKNTYSDQKFTEEAMEKLVIEPLDEIRAKIKELTEQVHVIKVRIETEGKLPGVEAFNTKF